MDLLAIVQGAIAAINPMQTALLLRSAGYTTNPDGRRVPVYGTPIPMQVQVQELTEADLHVSDNLNLQGETKKIYLEGDWNGVIRPDGRGGDLVSVAGQVWLVVQVLENWPNWTAVLAVRQIDTALP